MRSMRYTFTALLATAGLAAAHASDVIVSESNMQGWGFFSENNPGGSGGLIVGPGSPPAGSGSAAFQLTDGSQGYALGTLAYEGVPLSEITELSYWTYRDGAGPQLPALQFAVDYNGSGTWQGRLVYEPYQTPGNVIVGNTWQEWDALEGRWWGTGGAGAAFAPQWSPKHWQDILDEFPNARILPVNGALLFKVGSGWPSFEGAVDKFTIGVSGVSTTYDFEKFDTREFVDTGSGPTSVENVWVAEHGEYIQDLVNQAQVGVKNHGQYVSAISHLGNWLRKEGYISNQQRAELVRGAAQSDIGK